ncbi:MAG TPA: class I SAM-dependent methyltransferase [Xanthobacteraceae bacterium]|nr:class I SAM-dependent methyltransferase [Xanthobacteraceae bacterium]
MARSNERDPFGDVREATLTHIRRHGCHCYPYFDGSFLGTIAGAAQAKRIVELGTALGYSSIWFAHGARDAKIDTIEFDAEHVKLAQANFAKAGYADRITVHNGDFSDVLPTLQPSYDVGFFDGHGPTMDYLAHFTRLLRKGGVLISTNLDYGGESSRYRKQLTDTSLWLTSFAAEDGRTGVSIKL